MPPKGAWLPRTRRATASSTSNSRPSIMDSCSGVVGCQGLERGGYIGQKVLGAESGPRQGQQTRWEQWGQRPLSTQACPQAAPAASWPRG